MNDNAFNLNSADIAVNTAGRKPPSIAISGLSVHYNNTAAISNAALNVPEGTLMTLVGPSGCGKPSLLNSINPMTDTIPGCVVRGTIYIDDLSVLDPGLDVNRLRRRVGMVFQQPNPFPVSIAENIRFPLREHGVRKRNELNDRMEAALRDTGLWNEVRNRLGASALTLSGGQQQRLCMARALALEPEVLLMDEPCSALDPMASEMIEGLILRLKNRYTLLMVTHNLAQARRLADYVTVCWVDDDCGCVVESGSHESIFINSSHPVTQAYCRGEKG